MQSRIILAVLISIFVFGKKIENYPQAAPSSNRIPEKISVSNAVFGIWTTPNPCARAAVWDAILTLIGTSRGRTRRKKSA